MRLQLTAITLVFSSSGKGEALANELAVLVLPVQPSDADLQKLVMPPEQMGRIDALVNSAGHGPRADILELTDDDWHKVWKSTSSAPYA